MFDNFYYFFTYEDSRDAFGIPHDLKILKEVFGVDDGGYRRSNEFWSCYSDRANSIVNRIRDPSRCAPGCASRTSGSATSMPGSRRSIRTSKGDNDIPFN